MGIEQAFHKLQVTRPIRRGVIPAGIGLTALLLATACSVRPESPAVTPTAPATLESPVPTTSVVNLRRGPFTYMTTPPAEAGDAAMTEEVLFFLRNPVVAEFLHSGKAQFYHVGPHNGRADHVDGDPTRLEPSLNPNLIAPEALKPNQQFRWSIEGYTSEALVVPDFIFRGNTPSLAQVDTRWALVLYAGGQPLPDRTLARENLIQVRFISLAQSDSGLQPDFVSPTHTTPKRIIFR